MERRLVSIIILHTNEQDYLVPCLRSVLAQTYTPVEILVADNHSEIDPTGLVAGIAPEARVLRNPENYGYCKANNLGIKASRGEFVLCLNSDMELEPAFVKKMVEAVERRLCYAAAQGKILHFPSRNRPEKIIDTVGALVTRSRRNFDRGQGEVDRGQYDAFEEIFGADGCAPLYRRSALEAAEVLGEYFDEEMFIYREVVDLSWRFQSLGLATVYTPEAVGWHHRTFSPDTRKRQSPFVKKLSYRNRFLTLVKNDTIGAWLRDSWRIVPFEIAMLGHALLRERFLIGAWKDFFRLLPRALAKRRVIRGKALVANSEVARLFVRSRRWYQKMVGARLTSRE